MLRQKNNEKDKFWSIPLVVLLFFAFAIAVFPAINTTQAATDSWTLVTDARAMKAYPDLRETVWQKAPNMLPNGQYDKIGLHRLVKTGIQPKGVIFMAGGMFSGEALISNFANDTSTMTESYNQPIYWANRGFDVYVIDQRDAFIQNLNLSQMGFLANWSFDNWMSDYKEAVNKAKEVSSAQKVFLVGVLNPGGNGAMMYASIYGKEDLRGIILLGGLGNRGEPVAAKRGGETNTYNLTKAINDMIASGTAATDGLPSSPRYKYAFSNPGGPAIDPTTGAPFTPTVNPITNKTWANITEYYTYVFSVSTAGSVDPTYRYSNLTNYLRYLAYHTRYLATRMLFEQTAMQDWVNCPNLKYDWDDHWKEINVPLIAFESGLYSNYTGKFQLVNGIANPDFTGIMLPNYGNLDLLSGPFSARDVSQPALDWMLSRYQPPSASAFSSATVMTGQTWYFFAHSSGSVGPNTYQWYEGTTLLTGQTSMLLPIAKTTAGTYTYTCKIIDSEGATATSNIITLTVINK
jgi:hypothetical protein